MKNMGEREAKILEKTESNFWPVQQISKGQESNAGINLNATLRKAERLVHNQEKIPLKQIPTIIA